MRTSYEKNKKSIEGAGYTKIRNLTASEKNMPQAELRILINNLSCFVPCNARASNNYKNRFILAYLCNMHPHVYIERFFKLKEIEINRDAFALSCLIQWVWRSSIRDGKPINLYLPSKRMKNIFIKWLNGDVC